MEKYQKTDKGKDQNIKKNLCYTAERTKIDSNFVFQCEKKILKSYSQYTRVRRYNHLSGETLKAILIKKKSEKEIKELKKKISFFFSLSFLHDNFF